MIRIRVSYLESLRRCVDTEWGDESELARAIRGNPDPPNWQMEAGTAWHAALAASGFRHDDDGYCSYGGYSFEAADIASARTHIGPGLWEVPGALEIIPGVSIEGTADHLRGLVIQDQKTKFSAADAKDYEPSLQWRTYLLIHGAACFRYNLWSFADPKDGYCELRGLTSFRMWPYVGMEAEVVEWVRTFLDWASERSLLECLERDPYRSAA